MNSITTTQYVVLFIYFNIFTRQHFLLHQFQFPRFPENPVPPRSGVELCAEYLALAVHIHTPHQHLPNTATLIPPHLERKEESVPLAVVSCHGILTAGWKTISNKNVRVFSKESERLLPKKYFSKTQTLVLAKNMRPALGVGFRPILQDNHRSYNQLSLVIYSGRQAAIPSFDLFVGFRITFPNHAF